MVVVANGETKTKAGPIVRGSAVVYRWLRRRWSHVTRKRAVNAWVLTGFAMLLYALMPHVIDGELRTNTQEFLLIVAGVSASAVFLPELTENLWNLKRDEVRQIVPVNKRKNLSKVLIAAASDDEQWNSLVYDKALAPLLEASADPRQYVNNMNYTAQVHLNNSKAFEDFTVHYHQVKVDSRSQRVLPEPESGTYSVSIAGTQDALIKEFNNPACLAREVVALHDATGNPLSGDNWRLVAKELCSVTLRINSTEIPLEKIEDGLEAGVEVLRWKFRHDAAEIGKRTPVRIDIEFPIRIGEERFPVYFSGFYCVGETNVELQVHGLPPETEIHCDAFFARGLNDRASATESAPSSQSYKSKSFSTPMESILWPGSGVVFNWHDCKTPHP